MARLSRLVGTWLALAGCSVVIASCGVTATRSTSATVPKTGSTSTTIPKSSSTSATSFQSSAPAQGGFAQDEDFCAQSPLDGTIEYRASNGIVTMDVAVEGLPPSALVGIDWANNTVRGYTVGSIATDENGASIPSSLKLFRPGETRGYKIVLTTLSIDSTTLGTLWPCGPPPVASAGVATDPVVTVMPGTGLVNGQEVRVSVSGFGEGGKVFLSECDHAEDANALGCGLQLAAQPFVVTGADRAGTATFIISGSAASKPNDTTLMQPCTALCVIVATQGSGGAWAVAPIAFGSSQLLNPSG